MIFVNKNKKLFYQYRFCDRFFPHNDFYYLRKFFATQYKKYKNSFLNIRRNKFFL